MYSLRVLFDNLEAQLTNAAHQILEISPLLQRVSVEYIPQVGYLVAVSEKEVPYLKTTLPANTEELAEESMWGTDEPPTKYNRINEGQFEQYEQYQFIYKQNGTCYFKNSITRGIVPHH